MGSEPTITPSSVVVWSDGPLAADIDGEVVLMSVADGLYFGLDTIGSDVWRRLAQPVRLADICADLTARYDAEPGLIERDVLELIAKLHARQLVEIRP
jgi:hypothetical protein